MAARICRHPLRIAENAPGWLTCDIHQADFLHREDCPGIGTPVCVERCMGGADPLVAYLDALYAMPSA